MKLSRKGALALMAEEAIVLSTYTDTAGVLTIGIGHTAAAGGLAPRIGMKITEQGAVDLFRQDVASFEDRVVKAIKVPLSQHEFDALVSFDYNTGQIGGGTVDDKINRGDKQAAIATLKQYVKSGGHALDGLRDRRAREAAMFTDGEYFPRAIPVYDVKGGKARAFDPASLVWGEETQRPEPVPPLPPDYAPLPEGSGKAWGVAFAGLIALMFGGGLYAYHAFVQFLEALP